jgi:acyl-CoA synthetase (AMP-forming)/AMP-acid ligase II
MALLCGRRAGEFDLKRVRAFINCSEPCKPKTFDRFADVFRASGVSAAQLHCCYAMAETVFAVSQTAPGAPGPRVRVEVRSIERGCLPRAVAAGADGLDLIATGAPLAGVAVSTHDEAGARLPEGAVGEIGISAPFLFAGYNRDPARTAERMRDGVYFTRDIGFVRDGQLYVLGRVDDLIIVNGRNLYAHEIEASLSAIAGLKPGRGVAVPLFDERVGSEVLVLICERDKASSRPDSDLKREIGDVVNSTFAVAPRRIEIVGEGWLVKTTSGKISRKENLARLLAAREPETRHA